MVVPIGKGHQTGARGGLAHQGVPVVCAPGETAAPIGAGPPARGDGKPRRRWPTGWGERGGGGGSPAQEAVTTLGAPVGDGNPHWHGLTGLGDGEFHLGGGRCLESACGGRQLQVERAHRLGRRGVSPKRLA